MPARADAPADAPDPYGRAFALRLGIGGGLRIAPDRFALSGSLGALIPLGDLVVLEVFGATGSAPGSDVHSTRLWLELTAGVRLETRTPEVRGYGSVRVTHAQDAPLDAWGDHFGPTLGGDMTYGLAHLTLVGGAAGVAWDVPGTRRRLVLGAELKVLGLVHGTGQAAHHGGPELPAVFADLSVYAAWAFF